MKVDHNDSRLPIASSASGTATADETTSTLELWRVPDRPIDERALERLSAMLERLHVLHEPAWRAAIGDDVSAAAGIALRNLIPGRDGAVGMLDLVMSAVLVHAVRGNCTARVVLEFGRRSLRR